MPVCYKRIDGLLLFFNENILADNTFLTPSQVSKFLEISLTTLRRWRKSFCSKIPFKKYESGVIRYNIKDVESFRKVNQQEKGPYVHMDFSEKAIRNRLKSSRLYDDGKWLN